MTAGRPGCCHRCTTVHGPSTLLSCRTAAVGSAGVARLAMSRTHLRPPPPCPDVLSVSTIGNLGVEQTTPIGEGLPAVAHGMTRVTTVEAPTCTLQEKEFSFIGIRDGTQNGDGTTIGLVASQCDVCSCGSRGRPRIKVGLNRFQWASYVWIKNAYMPACRRCLRGQRVCLVRRCRYGRVGRCHRSSIMCSVF